MDQNQEKMNENLKILTLSKNSSLIIDNQVTQTCNAIKFLSEFSTSETLAELSKLNNKNYPNLSIFIIEDENFEFLTTNSRKSEIEAIKEHVAKFQSNFSKIMMQLTSESENITKFYYKINLQTFSEIKCEHFVQLADDQLLNLMVDQGKRFENFDYCDEFL